MQPTASVVRHAPVFKEHQDQNGIGLEKGGGQDTGRNAKTFATS